MYKIKYLITGHVFLLPEDTAKDLKKQFPDDYQIIEKNGKKFKDTKKKKNTDVKDGSIRDKVVEV